MIDSKVKELINSLENEIISFTSDLVKIKSNTCQEKEIAMFVKQRMLTLGYDKVIEDDMGNIIGIMGTGKPYALFDGHIDAVDVIDADEWKYGPYSGEIVDGNLYGRGSSDMKSGVAASIYGVYAAKKAGILPQNKSIWVSASLMEEDYDGAALKYVMEHMEEKPEFVVCCEPTENLRVANGHRGRSTIEINAEGIACHGSSPELGDNPIYKLTEVLKRIEKLNDDFYKMPKGHPSVTATKIYCQTASENAVPMQASVVLDRRTAVGETEKDISQEMDNLIKGLKGISWKFKDYDSVSWKGEKFTFHNFMAAWELSPTHPLIVKTSALVEEVCNHKAEIFKFGGNTNATTSAGTFEIPSVIIGPGNLYTAHSRDEFCPVKDIIQACQIYAMLCTEN